MGKDMNDNNKTNAFFFWLPGLLNIHVFVEVENKNRTEQKALLKSNLFLQSWSLGRNMCLVQSLPNTPKN